MKKIISILFILSVVIVSCDQDNIGTLYEPETPYVAFSSSVVPENILSSETNYSVSVQLVRSDLSGTTTANISLEMNDDIEGVFDLESNTVTFADGEGTAYVKIVPVVAPELINPAKTYTFKLTLTGDNASEFFGTTTYNAFFDIEYSPAGSGIFDSPFFEETWSVDLLKADLGDNLIVYKALGLYQDGYDMIIVVSGGNVTVADQPAWYYDDEYGDVYAGGSGSISGNVLSMSLTHFIPDVYTWEPYTEVLTLPE